MFFAATVAIVVKSFTTVKQGTEKASVLFGKYRRTLTPGLRFVGLWPLWGVYRYWFSWTGVEEDGKLKAHPREKLDYVLTKDDVYACAVRNAEDKNLVPLTWLIVLTIRIVDTFKALFEVQNWLETLVNRISPYVRDFSTLYTYEDLIQTDIQLEKKILERLQQEGIIAEFLNRYGVEIRGLEVRDVDPGAEFRKMTLQKRQGRANKEQALEEIAGWISSSVASELQMTPDELKRKLASDPAFAKTPEYQAALRFAKDMMARERAGDKGELRDIRVGGTHGEPVDLAGLIAGAAAAWGSKGSSGQSNSGGGGQGRRGGRDRGGRGDRKQPERIETPEQLRQAQEQARRAPEDSEDE